MNLKADGRPANRRDIAFKAVLVAGSILVIYLSATRNPRASAWEVIRTVPFGVALLTAGSVYAGLCAAWSTWRLILAIRYRATPIAEWAALPRISVIVPVYNEAALISNTLRSLSRAKYPSERLEIIVVDDGSTDGSWTQIQRAAEMDGRIRPLRLPVNQGKRHALHEGFRHTSGDVWVTVDSDSLIEPDALRAIVSPMIADPSVGAVAGNVRVLNKADGLIPLMLDVRYVTTFDYKRAAQSMMDGGSVLCVAGALAAYRRAAVEPHLKEWLHQRWLGRPARAGEDHAMTNLALRNAFKVRYQRSAVVRTMSPTTYHGIARMFLRWGRSNVRETFELGRHLVAAPRFFDRPAMTLNYIMGAVGLFLPYAFLAVTLAMALVWPVTFGLKLLAACVSSSLFPILFYAAFRRSSDALYAIAYSLYSTLLLSWIWPWALVTSHKSVWMTRGSAPPLSSGHGMAPSPVHAPIAPAGLPV